MTTLHEIFVEGHKLAARSYNPHTSGTPIVLLHGITGSIDLWHVSQLTSLMLHGPCYSFSLPGHYPAIFPEGYSEKDISADMMTRVLMTGIRDLLGEQPVILIGHSTGGFSALALAARYPELAKQVASVSGFARGKWYGVLGLAQISARSGLWGERFVRSLYALNRINPTLQSMNWRFYVANTRELFAYPQFKDLHRGFYSNFRNLDLHAMTAYFKAMPDINITRWLPRIQAPTLLLSGALDQIIPVEENKRIVKLIPNADLVVIEDCGHLPQIEKFNQYNKSILDWLG